MACTESLTALHVGGRSADDIDAGGVLDGFSGVLVRDGYAGYQHLVDAVHAWYGAHCYAGAIVQMRERQCARATGLQQRALTLADRFEPPNEVVVNVYTRRPRSRNPQPSHYP